MEGVIADPQPSSRSTFISRDAATTTSPKDRENGIVQEADPRSRKELFWWSLGTVLAVCMAMALMVTIGLKYRKRSPPPVDTTKIPGNVVDTWVGGPVIATNFADPCFIEVDDIYYAFATNEYVKPRPGQLNIQVAVSKDFSVWNLTDTDALPNAGPWSTGSYTWAPDVIHLDSGTFVMYYSACRLNTTDHHCVGAATSDNVMGPYNPLPEPLACPLDQGGAIDPDGFKDVDGTRYMVYKIDGNSLDNKITGSNFHPTPLMLQKVDPNDGVTLLGSPIKLLDRGPQDGPLIEAPSLTRAADLSGKNPTYVLFYSSNVFTTSHYDVTYATSTNGINGPYTKSPTPLLQTGDDMGRLWAPGGLDVGMGGGKVVFHSGYDGASTVRQMWTGQIVVNGTTVHLNGYGLGNELRGPEAWYERSVGHDTQGYIKRGI